MKQNNYSYTFELPTELLWQMGMILYRFKRPYKIDMTDKEVCLFHIDTDYETALEMKALLDEQVEEEGLDITCQEVNYCCEVPGALLRQLMETLKDSDWEFSAEAVGGDTYHVIISMEPNDFMEMTADAWDA